MERITNIKSMREYADEQRRSGKKIGFVPTMGYLHEGHLSLIDEAKKHSDIVIVSIFVNPTQFGSNEDLDNYPRDLPRDETLAESRKADIIFYPDVKEMYSTPNLTWVNVEKITDVLCGAKREGHFRGVTTVVTKLFNIVKPHIAVFGQKDAQQAAVITKMVEDMNMDVEIILSPIIRETDGLAMSSRNVRLTKENRVNALVLSRSLFMIQKGIEAGKGFKELLELASEDISSTKGAELEYLEVRSYPDLNTLEYYKKGQSLIAVAAHLGKVRLIDNILI